MHYFVPHSFIHLTVVFISIVYTIVIVILFILIAGEHNAMFKLLSHRTRNLYSIQGE